MTNPLVGHVLGSHGHMLLSHMLVQGFVSHVVGISQGHMVEDSLWLLVVDQALLQAQEGVR